MIFSRTLIWFAWLSLLSGAVPGHAAESAKHTTRFDIWFTALKIAPLPVGKATFDFIYDDTHYRLALRGETVGVADMVSQGEGTAHSSGAISPQGIIAESHDVMAVQKKKRSTLHMTFANGSVDKVDIQPKSAIRTKNGPRWIQLGPDDLRSVIDPASSILVPVADDVADGETVCTRTLRVYDGDTRYDMKLSYKSTRPVKTKGYEGTAFVCRMRYVPVSGHERDQKNVDYMSRNMGMEIWLAPMEGAKFYSPIRVFVPSWIGNFSAEPTYFGPTPG